MWSTPGQMFGTGLIFLLISWAVYEKIHQDTENKTKTLSQNEGTAKAEESLDFSAYGL